LLESLNGNNKEPISRIYRYASDIEIIHSTVQETVIGHTTNYEVSPKKLAIPRTVIKGD
jgi:hypothetical protein